MIPVAARPAAAAAAIITICLMALDLYMGDVLSAVLWPVIVIAIVGLKFWAYGAIHDGTGRLIYARAEVTEDDGEQAIPATLAHQGPQVADVVLGTGAWLLFSGAAFAREAFVHNGSIWRAAAVVTVATAVVVYCGVTSVRDELKSDLRDLRRGVDRFTGERPDEV